MIELIAFAFLALWLFALTATVIYLLVSNAKQQAITDIYCKGESNKYNKPIDRRSVPPSINSNNNSDEPRGLTRAELKSRNPVKEAGAKGEEKLVELIKAKK